MTKNLITVKVKLFAIYSEICKEKELTLNIPDQSKVKDILDIIIQKQPSLKNWENITKLAVNLEFVSPNFEVKNGDEIALIPPVSGG
ncbi:molybdenum cofactor biosynthesis protein MoaD [Geminocystis sp. NIES-3708]|uniref:MoaD/ThiS family protein n=1 Tax=Geminocystis sp. NIES-3708 TaxID=1615909 RepID=UPI0005FC6285|nr:MoaD/ThiS family protein [Geminocystis sp. NIES-3708]BAQ61752.1 molybdenum cofactor biosynthesis protein MoaD [Geminocystis sp. NIES-3708]